MYVEIARPPLETTRSGHPRRIGVELEFAGLECSEAGELVQALFGGRISWRDSYFLTVEDSTLGDFQIELDMDLAHAREASKAGEDTALTRRLEEGFAELMGDIGSLWLPVEIACPPIELDRLPEIDSLVVALRRAGAEGTLSGLLHAFGAQLNPEVADTSVDYVLRHLRAYLVLSDWLREEIDVDLKRRLTPFVDPFPRSYCLDVMREGYAPDLGDLIDDYIAANPTRNRELDLLPLFLHLDPQRVRRRLPDPLIKARPTFHYRLPDSRIEDPEWSVALEWNRWVVVERLANDPDRLAEAMAAYVEHFSSLLPLGWSEKAARWASA